jgi:hypothetical protein
MAADVRVKAAGDTRAVFVLVRRSKTAQFGTPVSIPLAELKGSTLCPVAWFAVYERLRDQRAQPYFYRLDNDGEEGVFLPLAPSSPNGILQKLMEPLRAAGEWFVSHSGRAGGATAAAEAGVQRHLIKTHGRWVDDRAVGYVSESLQNVLSVSRAIGSFASSAQPDPRFVERYRKPPASVQRAAAKPAATKQAQQLSVKRNVTLPLNPTGIAASSRVTAKRPRTPSLADATRLLRLAQGRRALR